MIKALLIVLGLTYSLIGFCQESDTMVLKIRNRINGYPTVKKNFQMEWRSPEPGQPYDRLDLNTDLQGETYNSTWLWQTFNFNGAKSWKVVSPVLPEGCELAYMMLANTETKKDFHLVLGFDGRSCIALGELLTKQKIKILFTDVPVYEENTIKDQLYMEIDDLHHSHISTNAATEKFEKFVNSTDHETLATYVSFDFSDPTTFDSCENVHIDNTIGSIIEIGSAANELTSDADIINFIHTIGEFTDRIKELADPQGLAQVKRCEKKEQFLSPVPRNGLLKEATSTFYYSLSSDFKMLIQTNKHD